MVQIKRVDVRIDSRLYYLLVLVLVVLGVNGLVYAYNSDWLGDPGQPDIVGHTPDEIMVRDSEGSLVTLAELTEQYNNVISQNFNNNGGTWSLKNVQSGGVVSGSVVGGGYYSFGAADCSKWGSSSCYRTPYGRIELRCGSGTSRVLTGIWERSKEKLYYYYVCIKN